jgi:dynein heavy chain 1
LDTWIERSPKKVPWDALSTLLSQCIYGGKIDNEFDQRTLDSIVGKIFSPQSFETGFLLVSGQEVQSGDSCSISMPGGIRRDQILKWVENKKLEKNKLPAHQTPAWLGLSNNAEKVLLTTRGTDIVTKLLKMQLLEDDDDEEDDSAYSASAQRDKDNAAAQRNDGRPAWMRSLLESTRTWRGLLPDSLVALRQTVEKIKDPLYLFFEREVNSGSKLLHDVRQDLNDVVLICKVNY